jgi:hypothetical protein
MGPSLSTIPTSQPSTAPSSGLTIRNPVFDPCVDTAEPLVGVTVILHNYMGMPVDETVTDEFGFYEFTGLPLGRYFVIVEYGECPSFLPSFQPSTYLLSHNPSIHVSNHVALPFYVGQHVLNLFLV